MEIILFRTFLPRCVVCVCVSVCVSLSYLLSKDTGYVYDYDNASNVRDKEREIGKKWETKYYFSFGWIPQKSLGAGGNENVNTRFALHANGGELAP